VAPEWLTAVASLLTLLVVAASAVAALIQLRHMRGGNQITALNEIRETFESEKFRTAILYVYRELPPLYADPAVRAELVAVPLPAEYEQARTVANFFENVGLFAKRGVLDRSFTADMWGDIILTAWLRLSPMITNRRIATKTPALWDNFEFIAVICKQFKDAHPDGAYPKGVERMPQSELW
jgi:hypothetical protein